MIPEIAGTVPLINLGFHPQLARLMIPEIAGTVPLFLECVQHRLLSAS